MALVGGEWPLVGGECPPPVLEGRVPPSPSVSPSQLRKQICTHNEKECEGAKGQSCHSYRSAGCADLKVCITTMVKTNPKMYAKYTAQK